MSTVHFCAGYAPCASGKRKLILDVDTGIDDALALAYLASFDDVEILGVIGTYGNVSADTAVRNTAYVLERLGFRNVPVCRGLDASLLGGLVHSRRRLRAVPWYGWPGRIRAGCLSCRRIRHMSRF